MVVDLRLMEVGEREVGEERGDRESLFLRFSFHISLQLLFLEHVNQANNEVQLFREVFKRKFREYLEFFPSN